MNCLINEHGHHCVSVTTRGVEGYRVPEVFSSIVIAGKAQELLYGKDYHSNHRFKSGVEVQVVLVPTEHLSHRVLSDYPLALQDRYGYKISQYDKGEAALLLASALSCEFFKENEVGLVLVLHRPVFKSDQTPWRFYISTSAGRRVMVGARQEVGYIRPERNEFVAILQDS